MSVAILVASIGCGDAADRQPAQSTAPVVTPDPVVTFAPLVHLHEDEKHFPLSAEKFIGYSSLLWSNDRCIIEYATVAIGAPRLKLKRDEPQPSLSAARLGGIARPYREQALGTDCEPARARRYASDELTRPYEPDRPAGLRGADGFSLNLLTAMLEGDPAIERSDDATRLRGVPIYVERLSELADGRAMLRLDYWMLYGRTGLDAGRQSAELNHEGGWERVSVLLRKARAPDSYVPVLVRYWPHGRPTTVPWTGAELHAAGRARPTHPVVYAAKGSHAPYPTAGRRQARVPSEVGPLVLRDRAEACDACPTWSTWQDVRLASDEPWWGYGGAWGSTAGRFTSGPLGPGSPR